MIEFLKEWQTLIWAIIWVSGSLIVWWVAKVLSDREKSYQNLLFLERVTVDNLNSILSAQQTIETFLHSKLDKFIDELRKTPTNSFILWKVFFPLFEVSRLNDDTIKNTTWSWYIDNLVLRLYDLTNNLPVIISDFRSQFEWIWEMNMILYQDKRISADELKEIYLKHLESFRLVLSKEMLEINLPICLKSAVQLHESLIDYTRLWRFNWNLRHHPFWRYYTNYALYLKDKEKNFVIIDNYFKNRIEIKLCEYIKRNKKRED